MRRVISQAVRFAGAAIAILFIASCAHQTSITSTNDIKNGPWAGRISLQIQSEPPQAFFAGFELSGQAGQGELRLTSPIGSTLGVMRWSATDAVLESGRDVKHFASVDALLEQTTGAAVPVAALFDWLGGKSTSLDGWTADLTQQGRGKITARRSSPAPQIELRIVQDQ